VRAKTKAQGITAQTRVVFMGVTVAGAKNEAFFPGRVEKD
jgi:hypothetical protein